MAIKEASISVLLRKEIDSRREDLRCGFFHDWNFNYETNDVDGLESKVRQAIRHMVTYKHQIDGSEYGGYQPDDDLAWKLNLVWFRKVGLLKPLVMQFEGDIAVALDFAWPNGFSEEEAAQILFSDPDSIEFWREFKKDLENIEEGKMNLAKFLINFNPVHNYLGRDYGKPGKYFGIWYTLINRGVKPVEYLTELCQPDSTDDEAVDLVNSARRLIDLKLKRQYGWNKEAQQTIGEPKFWEEFKHDLASLKDKLTFYQFLLGFTTPDVKVQPWHNGNGKYRYVYAALKVGKSAESEEDEESLIKEPHRAFYESAPLDVKLLLISKFPNQFRHFALDTIIEHGNFQPEILSMIESLGILTDDTQEAVLSCLASYLIAKDPLLEQLNNSEAVIILDSLVRKLQSEAKAREPFKLETIVDNSLFMATVLRDAGQVEESSLVSAARELTDAFKKFYFIPIFRSLLYKPAAFYWALYLKENHQNTVPPSSMRRFLQVFCAGKLKFSDLLRDQAQEVQRFIESQVLPDIFDYFARIAEFAPQIKFFRQVEPDGSPRHLFLHQIEGIRDLILRRSGILSDEPGTGKTLVLALTALNLIDREKGDGNGGRIMIVGTNSVIDNWEGELEKHIDMEQNNIGVVSINFTGENGSRQAKQQLRRRLERLEKALQRGDSMKQFVLVNYDLFRDPRFGKILAKYPMDVLAIDEAHNVKSRLPGAIGEDGDSEGVALRTSGLYRYIGSNPQMARFIATSTPFVKELVETLIMGHLVAPSLIPPDRVRDLMDDAVATHKLLRQVMVRRRKEEIADLPPKETKFIPIDLQTMPDEGKAEFIEVARALIERSPNSFSMLYSLLSLEGLAKYPWLISKVQELIDEGRKVVVFTPFVSGRGKLTSAISTARIAEKLRTAGISSVGILDGSIEEAERLAMQRDFRRKDGIKVLVGNYLTAGESITLISPENRATEVILFVVPNSISRYLNSIDRVHRFGQEEEVTIHIPYVTGDLLGRVGGTYDERIVRLLAEELGQFMAVVDGQFFIESDFYQNIVKANRISIKNGEGFKIAELTPVAPTRGEGRPHLRTGPEPNLSGEILDGKGEESFPPLTIYEDGYVQFKGPTTLREIPVQVPGRQSAEAEGIMGAYLEHIHQYLRLTPEQEQILYRCIKEGKTLEDLRRDSEFLDTVVTDEDREKFTNTVRDSKDLRGFVANANLGLVFSRARKYQGVGLEFWDLVQEGSVGLMAAVDRFDPTNGAHFGTFAFYWINQALKRAIAEKSRIIDLPVYLHDATNYARRVINEYLIENGRPPKAAELRELMQVKNPKLSVSTINLVIATLQGPTLTVASLNQAVRNDEGAGELADFVPDGQNFAENVAEHETLLGLIQEIYKVMGKRLTQRENEALRLRFGLDDGRERTHDEVGQKMGGITRQRVQKLEANALQKLGLDLTLQAKWREKEPEYQTSKNLFRREFDSGEKGL